MGESLFDVAAKALEFFCAPNWKYPRPRRNTLLEVTSWAISGGIAWSPAGLSVGPGKEKRPNRALLTLLHGHVHHNTFAALRAYEGFDGRESREGIQSATIGAADATDHSRCHLHHDRGGEFRGHSPDDGAAFVAGYVSLIAAHLDNGAAAAIRSCSHLVGDDRKALFIVGHRSDYLAIRGEYARVAL
jgi:hypothetical protein